MHCEINSTNACYFFIGTVLLLLVVPASAGTVTRTVNYDDVYMKTAGGIDVFTYRTAIITLTPSPNTQFDLPGYAVTETVPSSFEITNITADMSIREGSTIKMIKWGSGELKYKVKLPKTTGAYSIIGTFKDENRNAGAIPSTEISVTPAPTSSSSTGTSNYDSSWVTPTAVPTTSTKQAQEKTEKETSTEKSKVITALQAQGETSKGKPLFALAILTAICALIATVAGVRYLALGRLTIINIISNTKGIFVNGKKVSLPYNIELENPHKEDISVYLKSSTDEINMQPHALQIPSRSAKNVIISDVREGCEGYIQVMKQSTEWGIL